MYILIFMGILFFILGYILKIINSTETKESNSYFTKQNPLTKTELQFVQTLKIFTDKYKLVIIPQVQLQSIFKTRNKKDISSFNKIKSKSIDFAIVDSNYNYKIFIELDDPSHSRLDRIKRDEFVNKIFFENNLNLKRIKVSKDYDLEMLDNLIKEVAN